MGAMRLLVIGAAGMLGHDLLAAAERAGHEPVGWDLPEIDITDAAATRAAITELAPAAVINCAAWTDVDGAEAEEELAARVNAEGAGNVAAAAAAAGALAIQISTDYSFDGTATEPYVESSPTSALGAYGRTKLAGELAVAEAATPDFAIVRTAWLFGPHGKNFVDTMRRLGAERDELAVVDDQVGCPTYTGHLAAALLEIAERGATGHMHVAGGGSCSWFDLAVATFEETGLDCRVRRQSTADLGRPAPRPAFSVLTSTRDDVPVLPHWREGLRAHLIRVEVAA
jgi:dTDP-4-dehydrorhamnose reductase